MDLIIVSRDVFMRALVHPGMVPPASGTARWRRQGFATVPHANTPFLCQTTVRRKVGAEKSLQL
ncbi:MAG: hypothetical protein HKN18_08930 [Silicimonas sp.]|nr:hypothetical protein [Silicimonas sp.]